MTATTATTGKLVYRRHANLNPAGHTYWMHLDGQIIGTVSRQEDGTWNGYAHGTTYAHRVALRSEAAFEVLLAHLCGPMGESVRAALDAEAHRR